MPSHPISSTRFLQPHSLERLVEGLWRGPSSGRVHVALFDTVYVREEILHELVLSGLPRPVYSKALTWSGELGEQLADLADLPASIILVLNLIRGQL